MRSRSSVTKLRWASLRIMWFPYVVTISFTRPTWPSCKRTLMPCGWVGDFVRISLTMPCVSLPVRWSCFRTISTIMPGLMWARVCPFMLVEFHCGHPRADLIIEQAGSHSRVCCGKRLDLLTRDAAGGDHHPAHIGKQERPAELEFLLLVEFCIMLDVFADTLLL